MKILHLLSLFLLPAAVQSTDFECNSSADCHNGGVCIAMQSNPHYCECAHGFGGADCSQSCDHTCENGGSCRFRSFGNSVQTFCECPPHQFMGEKCEIQFVICPGPAQVKCFHGGTCQRTSDGYDCDCPPSHMGEFCQLEATKKDKPTRASDAEEHTTTSSTSSSNNPPGKIYDDSEVQTAFILFIVVLVLAAIVTTIALVWCRRQTPIDTKLEEDITTGEGVPSVSEGEIPVGSEGEVPAVPANNSEVC